MAKSKMGRPRLQLDWAAIEKLAHIQCTQEEIASFVGVDIDTLCNHAKREHGVTFSEYLKQKRDGGKSSLRRAQWLAAVDTKNPALLIFLGKNYLNQSDKQEIKQDVEMKADHKISQDQIIDIVKKTMK